MTSVVGPPVRDDAGGLPIPAVRARAVGVFTLARTSIRERPHCRCADRCLRCPQSSGTLSSETARRRRRNKSGDGAAGDRVSATGG